MTRNEEAVPELWVELEARLREFVRRRLPQSSDVEDVLQEVLVRLHRNLDALDDKSRAPAWVFQVATNAIADHYRSQARRTAVFEDDELPVDEGDPGAEAREEIGRCLEPFLARIPEPHQEAVRRVDLQGQSQVEAAKTLGLSVSGMKSCVQRGRERLRKLLTDCCRIEFDRRGQVVDYDRREGADSACCSSSGDGPTPSSAVPKEPAP